MEEDLRSLRSEYDYGSKKKFIDVLGNVSTQAKLNRLRAEHEINKAGGAMSLKGSQKTNSKASYKSQLSKLSQRSKLSKRSQMALGVGGQRATGMAEAAANAIPEDANGEAAFDDDEELEAKPEDFVCCRVCMRELSEDEKIINARFVNEAMAASRDISVFPICIACNFE